MAVKAEQIAAHDISNADWDTPFRGSPSSDTGEFSRLEQPSGNQFPAKHGAQAAPGNGALPPGHNAFRANKRKAHKTTAAFVAKYGG